ncbi:MAG: VpsF family polysaccharide biosynthesis protein [Chthoniobacterales bacterium]
MLTRFAVSPQIVDRIMNYTRDNTGAFYEKLHFGTYAIFLLAPFVLFSRPFVLTADEIGKFRWLARYIFWMLTLVAYLIGTGRAGSSGFLIDSYVVAAVAGIMMLGLEEGYRRALGDLTVAMLILSAAIGIAEAVTRQRLLPYDAIELEFRPIGLADHPLGLGALCATAIGFIPLTRWRIWIKVAAVGLLFVGCAASGARFALLTSVAEIIVMLLFLPWSGFDRKHARQAKFAVLLIALICGAALAAAMSAAGLLNRFESTLFDANFMVRVSIYDVFNYVGWNDILFGMRAEDLLAVVQQTLHLPTIESAPVTLILLLGLPLAICFTVLVARTIYRLVKGAQPAAWIGTAAFLAASLSNNTLSGKTPTVTILVVLLVAYAIPKSRHAQPAV